MKLLTISIQHLGIYDQIFSLEFRGRVGEQPAESVSTTAHKTALLDVFLHEFFVKFWPQSVIHKPLVLLCFIYALGTILEDNIIIPPAKKDVFNFGKSTWCYLQKAFKYSLAFLFQCITSNSSLGENCKLQKEKICSSEASHLLNGLELEAIISVHWRLP